jgi:hypothetical protein
MGASLAFNIDGEMVVDRRVIFAYVMNKMAPGGGPIAWALAERVKAIVNRQATEMAWAVGLSRSAHHFAQRILPMRLASIGLLPFPLFSFFLFGLGAEGNNQAGRGCSAFPGSMLQEGSGFSGPRA